MNPVTKLFIAAAIGCGCLFTSGVSQAQEMPVLTSGRQVDQDFRGYIQENLLIPVQDAQTALVRIDDKQVVIDGYWEFKDETGQVLDRPIILSQPIDMTDQMVFALRSTGSAFVEVTENGVTKTYRFTVASRFRENEVEKELEEAIMNFVGDPGLRVKVLPPQASLVGANMSRSFGAETASDIMAPRGETAGAATGQVLGADDFRSTIVLEGMVENDLVKTKALNIAHAYTANVVNLMSVRNPLQVKIGVKVVRVDHSKETQIGIRHRTGSDGTLQPFRMNFTSAAPFFETGNGIDGTLPIFGSNALVPGNFRTTVTLDGRGTKATLIQEPTLTVLNGQPAEFTVGQEVSLPSGFVLDANGNPISTFTRREVGVSLLVTPLIREEETYRPRTDGTIPWSNITAQESGWSREGGGQPRGQMLNTISENGIIQMAVQPIISSIGPLVNGITSFNTNRVETRVAMRHGESLVIGGLFDDQTIKALEEVPFISKIPILGELFKHRDNEITHSELIFVLTPEVLGIKDLNNAKDLQPRMEETRDALVKAKVIKPVNPVRISGQDVFIRPVEQPSSDELSAPPFPEVAPRSSAAGAEEAVPAQNQAETNSDTAL